MALPEAVQQIITQYFDFSTLTRNDWILLGAFTVGCFLIVLATNEFMEWKYFRYY